MSSSGDLALQAAIFDLGGVILQVRVENIFRHWAQAIGVAPEEVRLKFRTDSYEPFERGEISPDEFHQVVADKLGAPISYDDFLTGWNNVFCGIVTGIEGLLAELSRLTRLVVLSNTNVLHARFFLEHHGEPFEHFERVFLSHEMRTRKPEPRCFQLVLGQLGLRAEETVFIDDSPGNVAAARQLGMNGIVATSTDKIRRDLCGLGVNLSE